ncbi:SHOCT domain-containing protein [Cellulophaga sp. Hel_I_12]|nr:SHOCT domain-containing protein [Cellulophaga sp. Hel_I_12]
MEILRERFARGEISEEEFEQRKKMLRENKKK